MMDYTVGDTIRKCFTTRAFATGIPTVLAGTPVLSVYEDGSITQITAGVSVTVSLDTVVGLNQLVIVATGGNGFDSGSDYSVVITTGTVGGVSVVGETVYTFSLGRSAAAVDLANGTDGLGALRTLLLDVPTVAEFNARSLVAASYFDPTADAVANVTLVATTTTNTDMRGTDSAALASVATEARLAELDAANMPADIDAIPTTTMRGTDSAALASVATEARLAELDAANMPAGIDAIPTTAMRGTDSAALASVATEARLAELDAANLPADLDAVLLDTGTTLPAQITAIFTTQMTEAYAADGVAPTPAQALMLIQQLLGDFSIAGTTLTVREVDGATTAATFTLDSATAPTDITRTT